MFDPYFIIVGSLAMVAGICIGWATGYEAGVLAAKAFYEGTRPRMRDK